MAQFRDRSFSSWILPISTHRICMASASPESAMDAPRSRLLRAYDGFSVHPVFNAAPPALMSVRGPHRLYGKSADRPYPRPSRHFGPTDSGASVTMAKETRRAASHRDRLVADKTKLTDTRGIDELHCHADWCRDILQQ